jgi:ABC-type bacteriocin/lantibiotic exporter with double-glycine peptidase domain
VGFLVLATLGLVIPGLVVPAFTKVFVDEILLEGTREWFKPLILGMLLTAALQAALTWLQQNCLARLQVKLALATTSKFFWRMLHLPMSFFSQRHAGELGPRVAANDRVATLLAEEIATKGLRVLVIVFFAAVMFSYDVLLTLVALTVAALNVVILRVVARKRRDGNRKLLKDAEKVMGTAMAGIQQIETIKAGGSESEFFSRWAGYHAKLLNSEQRLGAFSLVLTSGPVLLGGISEITVLLLGGLRVMDGQLTIGMLVAFQGLMRNFLEPVRDMVRVAGTVQEVEGEMNRLDDVLKFETISDPRPAHAQAPAETPPILVGKIELRDMSFGYNRCADPLIKGFSLKMAPGSRVALVGGSGSGKSTISRIVTGLYAPWSGEVLLDDTPRPMLPPSVIANSLALVDQDIVLFAGTIRDNLTLWDPTISDANVIQAAKTPAFTRRSWRARRDTTAWWTKAAPTSAVDNGSASRSRAALPATRASWCSMRLPVRSIRRPSRSSIKIYGEEAALV